MAASIIPPHGFYVYRHRRATTGEVFYVGKGHGDRAWWRKGRTRYWNNIVERDGFVVEIVESGLQEWYAFELEIELIAYHGRKDLGYGPLVNVSDGGEGPKGWVASKEQRAKTRDITLQQWADNPELRVQMSQRMKNYWSDPVNLARKSKETRQRLSSPEVRAAHSAKVKAKWADPTFAKEITAILRANAEKKKKPVYCVELARTFDCCTDAANYLKSIGVKIEPKHISSCVASKVRIKAKGYTFVRPGETPNVKGQKQKKPVCCVEIKETFASAKDAVAWLKTIGYFKASTGRLCDAIKDLTVAYGYTWRYAEKETGAEAPVPSAV